MGKFFEKTAISLNLINAAAGRARFLSGLRRTKDSISIYGSQRLSRKGKVKLQRQARYFEQAFRENKGSRYPSL